MAEANNLNPDYINADFVFEHLNAITGRDPKTGQFIKGKSGNPKGRPKDKTNMQECMNMVFSQKTQITINGKSKSMTILGASCYKIVMSALADEDPKPLMQLMKIFGPRIDITEELRSRKSYDPAKEAKRYEDDPMVKMIKEAILSDMDEKRGINRRPKPLD